jgi:hypothetical protein
LIQRKLFVYKYLRFQLGVCHAWQP